MTSPANPDHEPVNCTAPMPDATDINVPYRLAMLVLSIYAILSLGALAAFDLSPEIARVIQYSDWVICGFFFIDFVRNFVNAPSRTRYFFTWGWLDLVSCIPVVDALRSARFARIFRILRIMRGIRAIRIITQSVPLHRTQSTATLALLASFLLVFVGSAAALIFEQGQNDNLNSAGQALWWAFVTMTTVGYGDTYPVTTEGRVVAVILMTAGVGLFGTLSGLLASWLVREQDMVSENHEQIVALRAEVRELKQMLTELQQQK